METAHIIGWNVVSAKLLSSHQSGHYRCRIVHGWCPPPVQLQSGGTFLAWTKLLQEMNLTKLLGGLLLHSASGLLLLSPSAPLSDLVCNMFTMNSAFREENIPRYVVLFTLTA